VDAGLAVSIVAVLISALSFALAMRADRRAGRAERRGLGARPVVELVASAPDASGRRFDLGVRNVGSGVARAVRIWLVDEAGEIVASSSREGAPTLAPGEEPVRISLSIPEASLPPPPVAYSVWIAWADDLGEHDRRPSGLSVFT
jgi:hypothetical protein